MGGSAANSPAVQRSLANFMDAALSTTVDGLRSTGKRIRDGNASLGKAMSEGYGDINLLDPARQIGLTSQGRGDPSIPRAINTPLVGGLQMGLGAANAGYRGVANLLGQGVEGVRSMLPKSLSDYVGTGAQFERDFNAFPEYLAGTGFGLIPATLGPGVAGGFAQGAAARNAERGMFAGVGAKNADLKALKVAEKLEAEGVDKDAIWSQTGWGRGADNKWRFEIDDSGSVYTPENYRNEYSFGNRYKTGRLQTILDHNKLYDDGYEFNANVAQRLSDDSTLGSYKKFRDEDFIDLRLGRGNEKEKSTLLHEIQHGIQEREGLNRGGDPKSLQPLTNPDLEEWHKLLQTDKDLINYRSAVSSVPYKLEMENANKFWKNVYEDKWESIWKDKSIDGDEKTRLLDDILKESRAETEKITPTIVLADKLAEKLKARGIPRQAPPFTLDGNAQYQRLSGEVEARNVQTRMNMTPAERLLTPPWKTEDVARDKQIVRFGGGKSMSLPTDDLPMDEASRMGRAKEMGFDVEAYHATSTPDTLSEFKNEKIGSNLDTGYYGTGHYFAPTPKQTEFYIAGNYDAAGDPIFFKGSQQIPVKLKMNKPYHIDKDTMHSRAAKENMEKELGFSSAAWPLYPDKRQDFMDALGKAGYDSVVVSYKGTPKEYVIPNPNQIRSRFAKFDPKKRDSSDLLAAGLPLSMMLGDEGDTPYDRLKRKFKSAK